MTQLSDYERGLARRQMTESWEIAADMQKEFAQGVKNYVSENDFHLVKDWTIWRWDPDPKWNTHRVIVVDIAEGASQKRLREIFDEYEILWHDGQDIHHFETGETYSMEDGKPGPKEAAEIHNTDMGNAARLVYWYGENLLYCHPWKKWLVWDGKRWKPDDTASVVRLAKKTVRRIYAEAGSRSRKKDREETGKWAIRSENKERINAMIELAKSEVPVLPDDLDGDPWLLTVANGTLNLRTGELLAHDPNLYMTRLAPVEYDPSAECPDFANFLDEIMGGDESMIESLQRAVGYSLTGDVSERALFLMHGSGANGKSTFLEVIRAALGDYAQRIATETLLVSRRSAGAATPDIARLKGARFVSASESEEGRRLAEAAIKDLTGGDTITARFLYGRGFDFRPECKIWLATNHKPTIRGTDRAIWDRIKLFPFEVTIPEEKQDKHLADKLKAELPGILAWAIQGCLDWQEHGLGLADKVKTATAAYQSEMDVLGGFIADCCIEGPDYEALAGDLLEAYKEWSGDKRMNQTRFGRALRERGFAKEKKTIEPHKGRILWKGIGLIVEKKTVDSSEHISSNFSSVGEDIGFNRKNPPLLSTVHQDDPLVEYSESIGGKVVKVETPDGTVEVPY